MIDTNVLSELMRPDPAASVQRWVARVGYDGLCVTAITQAEILSGIAILPPGRRRDALDSAAHKTFATGFAGPILSFDSKAAEHYAEIIALRRRLGRSTAPLDMMIVAIARSNGAAVATRNINDFSGCGVALHDPWKEAAL